MLHEQSIQKMEEAIEEDAKIELSREEAKELRKSQKQLEVQRADLVNRRNQLDQTIKEVQALLSGIEKVFKSK